MSTFERYLTIWVALCIIVGIAFGHFFPTVFHSIGSVEIAKVNLPVAILIWLMIIPMLVKIDFTALSRVKEHSRGIGVTLVINWAVKPFSMALLGWIFMGWLFRVLFIGSDKQLHRRPHPPRRSAMHRDGVCLEQPLGWRAAFHAEPSRAQRRDYGVRLCADRRPSAWHIGDHCAMGDFAPVSRPIHCRTGHHCAGHSAEHDRERRTRRTQQLLSTLQPISLAALLATLCCCSASRANKFFPNP